jgi:phosphate starvation-inducible PhoH-like protein
LNTTTQFFTPDPVDNTRLANLCGPVDENLRQIAAALDVTLFRRGEKFIADGENAERAVALLERFYAEAQRPISVNDVQLALAEARAGVGNSSTSAQRADNGADSESDDAVDNPVLKQNLSCGCLRC